MKGRLDPAQEIHGLGGTTAGDFWAWAYSDLHNNTIRPVLAEYIVGVLLGAQSDGRVPWDSYDLTYRGHGVEVKSSAYVQSWSESLTERIMFDIKRSRTSEDGRSYAPDPDRSADCYVFCLWPITDRSALPLDASKWEFYVLSTRTIEATFGAQKSLSLNPLRALTAPVGHLALRSAVDQTLQLPPHTELP